jgi:hypothetical protein
MSDEAQQFRIAEIEVAKSLSDEAIVGVFRFENQSRQKPGPSLLVLADIHSTLYAYERLLDVINAAAEQARLLVSQVDQDPLARFEKLVERLNEAVAKFIREEATPLQWGRINIFIMELSEGHLCFTGTGKLMNIFLQKQPDGGFKQFDLLGSLEQPAQPEPEKPFASIVCGDIGIGDVLIAGTQNLERLRSDLRLSDRLSTLPPVTAAMEIRQDLEKRSIPDDFVAVIVASHEVKPSTAQLPLKLNEDETRETPTSSITKLRETEAEATQHLAPVLSPADKLQDTADKLKNLAAKAKQAGASLLQLAKRSGRRSSVNDPVAVASLRGLNAGYKMRLTAKHKLMIFGGLALVVLVTIGLAWSNHNKKIAAEIAAWNATYDSAVDNRNRAESDLVYGNELRARTQIEQAEQILSALPSAEPDRQAKISKLTQELLDLRERLKRVVKLENVAELYAAGAGAAPGSLAGVLLVKDTVYAVDQASREIIKLNLTTREIKRIQLPAVTGQIVAANEGTDSILFATSEGKLVALNKSTDLAKAMAWQQQGEVSQTQDVVLYAGRLYRLDPQNSQIWRASNTGGAFGSETAYIKAADISISGAVSLAIDSNVYVLKNDGQLLQFLSGGQVSFGLTAIDPPVRAASALWTSADSPLLIITDPADKRLLVYEKNGSLKAQYVSSQFRELRDVVSDDSGKRIIAIDGNRLLLVPLP